MHPSQLLRALAFAAEKHRDQRRKDAGASPYINHPIAVATVLATEGDVSDEDILLAAILHDTVEETTFSEIEEQFGAAVAGLSALERTGRSWMPRHQCPSSIRYSMKRSSEPALRYRPSRSETVHFKGCCYLADRVRIVRVSRSRIPIAAVLPRAISPRRCWPRICCSLSFLSACIRLGFGPTKVSSLPPAPPVPPSFSMEWFLSTSRIL